MIDLDEAMAKAEAMFEELHEHNLDEGEQIIRQQGASEEEVLDFIEGQVALYAKWKSVEFPKLKLELEALVKGDGALLH